MLLMKIKMFYSFTLLQSHQVSCFHHQVFLCHHHPVPSPFLASSIHPVQKLTVLFIIHNPRYSSNYYLGRIYSYQVTLGFQLFKSNVKRILSIGECRYLVYFRFIWELATFLQLCTHSLSNKMHFSRDECAGTFSQDISFMQ